MIEASSRTALESLMGDRIVFDEPLSRHTSLRIGGPAEAMATPADREELGRESQFVDLHFREVLADPVGSLQKAFSALDLPLSDTAVEQMNAWQESHQPERHGTHQYSAEEYGLDPEELSDAFREYRDQYGIPSE